MPTRERNCAVNFFTDHITVRSEISGWSQMQAVKVDYYIKLDNRWRVQEFEVIAQTGNHPGHVYAMRRDNNGHWRDKAGNEKDQFLGCDYIDITLTPFTNSLPINGLVLNNGKSRDIDVLYIDIMENEVRRDRQRYIKLDRLKYRFENDNGNFTADINVDEDGFVTDYPELFESI
jgi:hypothetical protein